MVCFMLLIKKNNKHVRKSLLAIEKSAKNVIDGSFEFYISKDYMFYPHL